MPTNSRLSQFNTRIMTTLGSGAGEMRIPPEHRAGEWYWVSVRGRWYGVGHEKGDIWGTIGVAEWIEFHIERGASYGMDPMLMSFSARLHTTYGKSFESIFSPLVTESSRTRSDTRANWTS